MVNIFCIGRNNVDVYLKYKMVYPGGNCSNVAAHFAKLGHQASLMTVVGDDVLGRLQLGSLKKLGVDITPSRVEKGHTAWCCIRHERGNREFVKSDLSIFRENLLTAADVGHVREKTYDVIYTSTCVDSFFAEGVMESLGSYKIPVCCDFADKWEKDKLYKACAYIHYPYLSCESYSLEETMEVLEKCVEHGAVLALGTRGMEGSVVYNGRKFYHQQAYRLPIVDTLGAGDSFLARFSMCYFQGMKEIALTELADCGDKEECLEMVQDSLITYSLRMAALYAAHVCGHYGGYGMGIPFYSEMIGMEEKDL